MRTSALALSALLIGGCAVINASGPDEHRPPWQPPRCNEGKASVAVDGIIAGALAFAAIVAARDSVEVTAGTGAVGGLFLGSALAGNASANRCRKAMDDYVAIARQTEPAPQGPWRLPSTVAAKPPPPPAPSPSPSPSPPPSPAPAPAPSPSPSPPPSTDDDWHDFWHEVTP